MPSSHYHQLNKIIDLIYFTRPQRLLDIGIGFGKYGFLAREYLELADGREQYDDWLRQIDGIEAFPEYIRPWHEQIYDNIFLGDARDIVPTLTTSYDLTLLIDVLEHFTYEDGWELIQQLQRHTRSLLISTPKDIGHQGDAFGNDYETHRFQWHPRHFRSLSHVFVVPNPYSWIIYYAADAPRIRQEIRRERLRYFLYRYAPWALPWALWLYRRRGRFLTLTPPFSR